MSTPAAPQPTTEQTLLDRQTRISSWSDFESRVLKNAERAPEPSERKVKDLSTMTKQERENWRETGDISVEKDKKPAPREHKESSELTREEREHWRATGEWPVKDGAPKPKEPEPKSAAELTPEERAHWKNTGNWPMKESPAERHSEPRGSDRKVVTDTTVPRLADTSAKTPEEVQAQHQRNVEHFNRQRQADPELKQALSSVDLGNERNNAMMDAMADLHPLQRREVAKELASRPELTEALKKQHPNQPKETIAMMAKMNEARGRYPDANRIFPAIQAILADKGIPLAVKRMLNSSDSVTDVLYHLTQSPQELQKFINLSKQDPDAALRHLAQTEAGIRGQRATEAQASQAQWQALQTQMADAKSRYGEAHTKIYSTVDTILGDRAIPLPIKEVLNDSDVVVDLLYTLGSDPKELAKFTALAKSNPSAAMRRLVTTERLVQEQLNRNSGKSQERDTAGRFQSSEPAEPVTRAPRPPVEVGGRTAHGGDDSGVEAVKSGDFRAAKAAFNRQYLKTHSS